MNYNTIGNIGSIVIKWHPIYKYTLWLESRCISEHTSLVAAVSEICEDYPEYINNFEIEEDDED